MRKALGVGISLGRDVINVEEAGTRYARTGFIVGTTIPIGRKMPTSINEFDIIAAKGCKTIFNRHEIAREGR